MSNEKTVGNEGRIVSLLKQLAIDFFALDIDKCSLSRNHKFWALGINSKTKMFRDLIGNINATSLAVLNKKFVDSDAGFRASAQKQLTELNEKADIFLINEDHLTKRDEDISPMLVHEICHFVEQTGQIKGKFSKAERRNAIEILAAYHDQVRSLHSDTWARLMARSARQAVDNHSAVSVVDYLEAAIPEYDRPDWKRRNILER